MQPPCYFIFSLLCCPPLLPSVLSLNCNQTQYAWPYNKATLCCDKCLPGQYLDRRSEKTCERICKPCLSDQFMESYNILMECEFCNSCDKANMEVESECNATRNTVCRCKAGYECKDKTCTECVVIPTTIKPTTPLSTTVPNFLTTRAAPKPVGDTVWFLVIIALMCAGIALFVVTKIKPVLLWIKSNCFFLDEKTHLEHTEENLVTRPIQEVCQTCDLPHVQCKSPLDSDPEIC